MDLVGLRRCSKSVRYFGRPACKALKVSVDSLKLICQSIGNQ